MTWSKAGNTKRQYCCTRTSCAISANGNSATTCAYFVVIIPAGTSHAMVRPPSAAAPTPTPTPWNTLVAAAENDVERRPLPSVPRARAQTLSGFRDHSRHRCQVYFQGCRRRVFQCWRESLWFEVCTELTRVGDRPSRVTPR